MTGSMADPQPDSPAEHVGGDRRHVLLAFAPYLLVSIAHVAALAAGLDDVARLSKLVLMPALVLAVMLGLRPLRGLAPALLLVAIVLSWGGDASLTLAGDLWFVVGLASFLLAHVAYIALFLRMPGGGPRLPAWTACYAVWYLVFLAMLGPHLGALLAPVAVYGLVLGATAAGAARCHPVIAWGGVFFLASDTILAFRLFTPDAMPDWTSPLVMLTYCLGQGLIAAGVLLSVRLRRSTATPAPTSAVPPTEAVA